MYLLTNHNLSYGCQASATDDLTWELVSQGSSCTDSSCDMEATTSASAIQNEAVEVHQVSTDEVENAFEILKQSFVTFIAYVYRAVTGIISLIRRTRLYRTELYRSSLFVLFGAELRL